MSSANILPQEGQETIAEKYKAIPKLQMGTFALQFEPEELDEFYIKKAKQELRETPEVVAEGLEGLKKMLQGEPDLVVPIEADDYLCRFLRPCKWYPQSAFELMKRFYNFRREHPNICRELVPSKERAVFKSGVITPLPRRCADGARILLIEGGKRWKPRELSLEEILKGAMLALEAAMSEPKTQVCGVRVILDMAGLSLTHVTYFTPSFAKAVIEWVQRCFPCRLKGVHIINQPFVFNMVFAIFKPFMQEKLRKRIHFHGTDRNGLLEYIDAKAVPERYGGNLEFPDEPIGEALWEYFCEFEENFQMSNKFGYVEKL